MSQYHFVTKNNTTVLFGLDKPTAGFFWSELAIDDELIDSASALTCSELVSQLKELYDYNEPIEFKLLLDFNEDPEPTQLQINVSKMFGVDLLERLKVVAKDVEEITTYIDNDGRW